MTAAISSPHIKPRSTVYPPTRIQRLEIPQTSVLSAQAIVRTQISIPIPYGDDVMFAACHKSGRSNFLISQTITRQSMSGL
jgi:hypothetical protein